MAVDVSVVIPTFRRPGLVGEAVRSALGQTGVSLEVLVVDDSPEGAARREIEDVGDPRVRYLKPATTSGGRPAIARNSGYRASTGRYLSFLDDDDRAADGAYGKLVRRLEADGRAGVAFGRVLPFGEDAEYLRHNEDVFREAARRARLGRLLRSRRVLLSSMLFCNPCLTCSACVVRREHFEALGGFDPELTPFEDADFFVRAIRGFGVVFVDEPVLHYRTGHASLMRELAGGSGAQQYRRMYRKYASEHGALELLAMKVLARTALRWV
jgi:glycosyltransferase involved in cell wall biosynthesis